MIDQTESYVLWPYLVILSVNGQTSIEISLEWRLLSNSGDQAERQEKTDSTIFGKKTFFTIQNYFKIWIIFVQKMFLFSFFIPN